MTLLVAVNAGFATMPGLAFSGFAISADPIGALLY